MKTSPHTFAAAAGRKSAVILAGCIAAWLASPSAQAASGTWLNTGVTDGNWATTSNWVSGIVPGATSGVASADTATFNTAVGTFGTVGSPILVDVTRNVKFVSFDTGAGGFTFGGTGPLVLSNAGEIKLASTLAGTGLTETFNVGIQTSGNTLFTNSTALAQNDLLSFGAISGNSTNTTQVMTFQGTGNIAVTGVISKGAATTYTLVSATSGTLTLSGSNTYNGSTTVNSGSTLSLTAGGLSGGGAITVNTGGNFNESSGVVISGASTLTVNGMATLAGANTNTGAITVNSGGLLSLTGGSLGGGGAITVSLGGTFNESNTATIGGASAFAVSGTALLTGANTHTGTTSVLTGGTLTLDFSGAAAPLTATNILNNSANTGTLTLAGGTLLLKGGGATAANSQRFNGTSFTANTSSAFKVIQNSAATVDITLGGLTRNAGSVVDLTLSTTGTVTSTTTSSIGTNKVLASSSAVAYATVGGLDWATNTAGVIGKLATYNTDTFTASQDTTIATVGVAGSAFTVNTLRFNLDGGSIVNTGASVVTSGGILVTSNATATGVAISGGSLKSGGGKEMVIINNGKLTISSDVIDSASGNSALTISSTTGQTGTTTLSGTANSIKNGLSVTATTAIVGNVDLGASNALVSNTGTLTLNGTTTSTGVLQVGNGATLRLASTGSVGSANLTLGNGNTALSKLVLAAGAALTSTPNVTLNQNASLGAPVTLEFDAASTTAGYTQNFGSLTANQKGVLTVTQTGNITGQAVAAFTNATFGASNNDTNGVTIAPTNGAAVTIAGTLTGAGAAGNGGILTLDGTSTGNVISGTVQNNDSAPGDGPVSIVKNNISTWKVTGTNLYTGGTTINVGTLVMANTQALGVNATAAAVTLGGIVGATLDVATDGSDTAYNASVGSGVLATIASDVKTGSVGLNHTLGALSIGGSATTNGTVLSITKGAAVVSGSPTITFPSVALAAGTGSNLYSTLSPTTASLVIGTVTSTSGGTTAKFLNLEGTSLGNQITGAISNGIIPVGLRKGNTSTWTLAGTNSYSAGTTVALNGGILEITNPGALGSGAVTLANTNSSTSEGVLQLSLTGGTLAVPNVIINAINFYGQSPLNGGGFAHLRNSAGFNNITGNLVFSNTGGLDANIVSEAGNLELSGTLSIGSIPTGTRTFDFGGAGTGLVSGLIVNGSRIAAVQKDGTGTWTLSGANTYTGSTVINRGTLSASSIVVTAGASNLGNSAGAVALGDLTTKGTLSYSGNTDNYTRGFTVAAGGGEIDTTTVGQVLTISGGAIASATDGSMTIGGAGDTIVTAAIQLGAGTLTKTGGGTVTLSGTQTYSTLTTSQGTTNVDSPIGTGTSFLVANATTNISVGQTLASLTIGPGAVVTFGAGSSAPFGAELAAIQDDSLVTSLPISASAAIVPEPCSMLLLLGGAAGLLNLRRNRAATSTQNDRS